ncbi:DUF4041 domain-containing protein [Streptantibioticus parmotrematis]|nr:DUF4041 domain-containing protein [Streptantibioticus parmotrematis]
MPDGTGGGSTGGGSPVEAGLGVEYVTPSVVPLPQARRGGLFGRRRRDENPEAERLRAWVASTQGMDALQVLDALQLAREEAEALREAASAEAERLLAEARDEVAREREAARRERKEAEAQAREESKKAVRDVGRARKEAEALRKDTHQARERLAELRAQVVTTDEVALLQEVGIYAYRHQLQDALAYRSRLESLQARIKTLAREGNAVLSAQHWTVNGSASAGRKMVRDFSKLMLRAYNAEADYAVRTMRPHRLDSLVDRLYKSRETIARLGATMNIRISDAYHDARVRELQLTADFLQKKEEEKEAQREIRAREREEAAAQRELEREREKLNKEMGHYQSALERLRLRGEDDAVAEMEAKLAEIEEALSSVEARAANVRAGYVYVISNVGAFGDRMVKIGLTRRLEPLERIYELSGASVPFRFDVHALIFSKDAVGLETQLHREFADHRVNRVNARKEFFRVTPAEVRDALQRYAGQHLVEFTEEPQALEWRASKAS